MASLYIHIPFCSKICSYCDFYKKTAISLVPGYLAALEKEMEDRSAYLEGEALETIYIGGGTPSVLQGDQLKGLFGMIRDHHEIMEGCEITLEANPDDLTVEYLASLARSTPVNRLSIGIQSFHDEELKLLNRRHNAPQAIRCIGQARDAGFHNLSIDLIYGLPGMETPAWKENLEIAFSLGVQHISAYHLTLEPGTALAKMHARGLIRIPDEDESSAQFFTLNRMAAEKGFNHYEISNLSGPGFESRHNSNYWLGKKYLGLGPSAHSFNRISRQWNISNLGRYMEALANGDPYYSSENLDITTRYNEYLMLSLRTSRGISLSVITRDFGQEFNARLVEQVKQAGHEGWMIRQDDRIVLTPAGWWASDYIVSRLLL